MVTTVTTRERAGTRNQELDRFLDAAMRAFLRHGVSRTRIPDIAEEADVSRTTVYRVVGPVERVAAALLEREVGRLLDVVTTAFRSANDWESVLEVCAEAIEEVERHALLRKVRDDEPAIIGTALVKQIGPVIDMASKALEPSFADLQTRGVTSGRDHRLVAETLVRLGITYVLAPPDGRIRRFLFELLGEVPGRTANQGR